MSDEEELDSYFSFLERDMSWNDLSAIGKISVCSGCFHYEEPAIRHLETVRVMAQRHGFSGELHILSSVIRTRKGLERVAAALSPFHLTLTIECFQNRHELLKRSKAELDFSEMIRILKDAKELGIKTDFTYLVGLDPLPIAEDRIGILLDAVSTFPRFQVYQAHNALQALYRTPGSERLEYYLEFRRMIENVFRESQLRPQSWENYRPLWYYSFDGQAAVSARI